MTITDPPLTDPTAWLLSLGRKVAVTDLTDDLVAAAVDYLANYTGSFDYLVRLKTATFRRNGTPPTRDQIKGILNCWRAAAVREAAPTPHARVVVGTVNIVGTILAVIVRNGMYGLEVKMRVMDDRGFVVWGTLPRAIDGAREGERVAFTATVTASDTDPTFGFFKRPRNAVLPDRPPVTDDGGDDGGEMLI
jgi:hypothetical protein